MNRKETRVAAGFLVFGFAKYLPRDHTVVVPNLRGMGLSSIPDGGYEKKTQAADIRAVLAALGIEHSVVIGHNIGTMVASWSAATAHYDVTD